MVFTAIGSARSKAKDTVIPGRAKREPGIPS
jgi:hypothetical protein